MTLMIGPVNYMRTQPKISFGPQGPQMSVCISKWCNSNPFCTCYSHRIQRTRTQQQRQLNTIDSHQRDRDLIPVETIQISQKSLIASVRVSIRHKLPQKFPSYRWLWPKPGNTRRLTERDCAIHAVVEHRELSTPLLIEQRRLLVMWA